MTAFWVVLACGLLAVLYGVFASRSVLAAPTGNDRMRQISAAVQEGAAAYLNRQYRAIAIVGVVIAVLLCNAATMLLLLGVIVWEIWRVVQATMPFLVWQATKAAG